MEKEPSGPTVPESLQHQEKEISIRETEPVHYGENVYTILIVREAATAQELATLKLKKKDCRITAMTVVGDRLLINFQETEIS